MDDLSRTALQNRLYGLLFLFFFGLLIGYAPPWKIAELRRGALGVVQDMGMGESAVTLRLVVYGAVSLLLISAGLYQVITGRRVRMPFL